jgi:hypothetical protein
LYNLTELKNDSQKLIELHQKMLRDNIIIPSMRDNALINPEIVEISQSDLNEMKSITESGSKLIMKVANMYLQGNIDNFKFNIPNEYSVIRDKTQMQVPFVGRSDVFKREGEGFFIAEYNWCKPSGQKETEIEKYFDIPNSPNVDFQQKLIAGLEQRFNEYYKDTSTVPSIAIICDTYKYEEITLGQYFKNIFESQGWKCDIVGVQNIKVEKGKVFAFEQEYNVILRRFPVEFNNEFPLFSLLNEMFTQGKLLMLNESRAIIPQNKDIFSVLWSLIESQELTIEEKEFIKKYIPYTINLSDFIKQYETPQKAFTVLKNGQRKWIIKQVYTRYSESVFVGKSIHPNDWFKIVATTMQKPSDFVVQEFIPIKNEPTEYYYSQIEKLAPEHFVAYENIKDLLIYHNEEQHIINTYINYGVHIINGEYAGVFARCSPTVVTHEDTVFLQPISIVN